MKLFYLAIGNVQKNIFIDTAEPEAIGGTLERFGRVKLGRNPFVAVSGEYEIDVTGLIGATIPASTTFKSNDDALNAGNLFILDSAFVLASSPDTITVRSLEAGLDSRLSVGNKLTATAPIANVDSLATTSAETIIPLAAETNEAYRAKGIEAYQLEPQGGAGSDYRIWSADAQGVQTVYPFAKAGFSSEVNVYVEATIADSTDGKGTPTTAILDDVYDVIQFDPDTTIPLNERGRRPLGTFETNTLSITVKDIEINVTGYVGLTTEKQILINNALTSFVNSVRPFVASADVLASKNDILSVNNLIFTVQSAVPGSVFTALELKVDTVSVPSFTFTNGDIPAIDTINYV